MPSFTIKPNSTGAPARRIAKLRAGSLWRLCLLVPALVFPLCAQTRIAVIAPEKQESTEKFVEKISESFEGRLKVLDRSLGETAFRSAEAENPFNLTTAESKTIGSALGSDFFLLVKTKNQPRFSFARKDYFEAFAALYLISSRTGRLVFWRLAAFEDARADAAEGKLLASAASLATEISAQVSIVAAREATEAPPPKMREIPAENSAEAADFRPPLPYRRISPVYTELADLYKVEATVDVEVDFDETGRVLRAEIVRWAGFGLDESVEKTVRQMNWRPAAQDGKPSSVRVLLRYNFRKIEKE